MMRSEPTSIIHQKVDKKKSDLRIQSAMHSTINPRPTTAASNDRRKSKQLKHIVQDSQRYMDQGKRNHEQPMQHEKLATDGSNCFMAFLSNVFAPFRKENVVLEQVPVLDTVDKKDITKQSHLQGIIIGDSSTTIEEDLFPETDQHFWNTSSSEIVDQDPATRDKATELDEMGDEYGNQGKLDQAMELHEQALHLRLEETMIGTNRQLGICTSYRKIANILRCQEKYDEALATYKKALALLEKHLCADHPDTAKTYNSMANVLSRQGKFDQAMEGYQKALNIRIKAFGWDHLNCSDTYCSIAGVLYHQGKYDGAMKIHQLVLAIRLQEVGHMDPAIADTYNNMACILYVQKKFSEALELYKRCMAIRMRTVGPKHPDSATTYYNTGNVLRKLEKYDEAIAMHEKTLQIRLKTIGRDHVDTADTCHCMAATMESQGRNLHARMMYEEALEIRQICLGEDHPETIKTKEILKELGA